MIVKEGLSPSNQCAPVIRWRDLAVAAVIFLAAFFFFQRGNGFPVHYHPDEPGKARQAIDAGFNFNHPLLLLQATRGVLALGGGARSPQSVVEAGRMVSAFFAALAAGLIALLAARMAGSLAGACAGLLAALNQQFYELAHYMKEDPALAAGVAAAALFFARFAGMPGVGNFALLCAACGLAACGKYIGVVTLLLPVAALIARRDAMAGRAGAALSSGAAAFAAVILAVNFPMLTAPGVMTRNVGEEIDFVVRGNKILTREVPHGVYGAVFRTSTNPAIWVLLVFFTADLLVGLAGRFLPQRWPKAADWLKRWPGPGACDLVSWGLFLFGWFYTLLLSFSPKTHHRYFLPVTGLLLVFAAAGALRARGRAWRPLALVTLAAAIVWSALITLEFDSAFARDPRRDLLALIANELPPDAGIAQDNRVGLPMPGDPRSPDPGIRLPQTVTGSMFAADLGTVAELRARGIRYVAVSGSIFNRFFLKGQRPREDGKDDFLRRQAFYNDLLTNAKLIWHSPSGRLQYLQPDLRLYEIGENLD